jgi:Heterokaryon incompatibility protein (HET)
MDLSSSEAYYMDNLWGEAKDPERMPASSSIPSAEPLDLDTPVLQVPADNSLDGCQNFTDKHSRYESFSAWDRDGDRLSKALSPWDMNFLNILGHHCIKSEIHDCHNARCVSNREKMNEVVPSSCDGWDKFRKWALVTMSCLRVLEESNDLKATTPSSVLTSISYLSAVLSYCNVLLVKYSHDPAVMSSTLVGKTKDHEVDLFSVCEIIHWISQANRYTKGQVWNPGSLPQHIAIPAVLQASIAARNMSLCQARLWNLVKASDRQHLDLPSIVDLARRIPLDDNRKHKDCAEDFCRFADDNSTLVRQLHKCQQNICNEYFFSPAKLEYAIELGLPTAWTVEQNPEVCCRPGEYMAISHVWADGTGLGLKRPGEINSCLTDYFVDIAKRLECHGIWWDTICMPTEREARKKAINNMHNCYENAKCTLVHDLALADVEWREDGSPCLALALSPWFTRGWTALELYVSKKVVVVFKDPDGQSRKPLLKDLDGDILAKDNAYTHPSHQLASFVTQRLRRRKREEKLDVHSLLAILQPRRTSWASDRMVIAGLMAEAPDFHSADVQSETTRKILTKFGSMDKSSLLHGHVTIRESGPWSWCATSLYDMQSSFHMNDLEVHSDGSVTGNWLCSMLTKPNNETLWPRSSQLSVRLRTMAALRRPENCLVLRPEPIASDRNLYLLVTTVGCQIIKGEKHFIQCRYIGTVTGPTLNEPCDNVNIKLGADQGKDEVDAKGLMRMYGDSLAPAGMSMKEEIDFILRLSGLSAGEFASVTA